MIQDDITGFLGLECVMQALIFDPGAVQGMSMTQGMAIRPE